MDRMSKERLETIIEKEVKLIFTEGDRDYLKSLSLTDLLEVTDLELRFLGLYSYENHETIGIIRQILEKHLDSWCQSHLWIRKMKNVPRP